VKYNVWGIGLTRTGTTSLHRALEILGYQSVHYPTLSQLFHQPLEAATDEPVAVTYKYLDFLHPQSKFVLTEREEDDWIRSTTGHRKRHFDRHRAWSPSESPFNKPGADWIQSQVSTILGQGLLRDRTVERVFTQMTLYETLEFDEERFRRGNRRYHDDVTRYFADRPGALLRMRICEGEGWERLCEFLEQKVPKVPFPSLNTAK
jgi:Sulfotransferase domain